MPIMLCWVSLQVSVGGGTRRPEATRQSQEWRRQHAAAAVAGLNYTFNNSPKAYPNQYLHTQTHWLTCGHTVSDTRTLKTPSSRKCCCCCCWILVSLELKESEMSWYEADERPETRGFLTQKGIWWCSIYLFIYLVLSSANSKKL